MTVPGKGGRPRKWLSNADRMRAYRARRRGEAEPETLDAALDAGDELAEALGRERRLLQQLTEAGFEVTVICPASPGQPPRETVRGVRVYRYPEPRPGDGLLGYLWEYGYSMTAATILSLVVLLRHGFDVVHALTPTAALAARAAGHRTV